MLETNYCVTATELKVLSQTRGFVAKETVQNSDKGVIKPEGTDNYYLSITPLNPFASNQLPRYQDFQCPDPGVTLTFTGIASGSGCTIGETTYIFQLGAGSQGPSAAGFTTIFDVTLPAGLKYKDFKYIYYNGQVLNPTAPFYNVTNQNPDYFRVELFKQIGYGNNYTISFTVERTTLYGTRNIQTNLTSRFCNISSTVPRGFTYTDTAPAVVGTLSAPWDIVDCGPVVQYEIDLVNTGAPTCGVIFEMTAPQGINIQSLEFNVRYTFYDWWCFWCINYKGCDSCGDLDPDFGLWDVTPALGWYSPVQVLYNDVLVTDSLTHTEFYDVLEFNETTNKIKVRFNKPLGNGNTYRMYFYGEWLDPNVTSKIFSSTGTYSYVTSSDGTRTTVSTNTVTEQLTRIYPVNYYELAGCNPSDYAITLIQPLGLNNRYVDPQTGAIYTYTGTIFSQCTVPSALNENIQRTNSYNCSDPTTTTTTTLANINFDISYNCTSNGINNITISNFSGGTGSYQANISPQISQSNAANGTFFQLTTPSYTYEYNQNGTWYIAVRDGNNSSRLTIKNTGNIRCCPNTTPDWRNNGSYSCYGTCNQYYVEQDYNDCSNSYGQTQQGQLRASNSTECGGCCGQGACCGQSTAQVATVNPIGNRYTCSNGTVTTTPVYGNTNQCYTGNNIYQINGAWQSTNPINSYPNVTANWSNNGIATCTGCTQYQPQIDINECSSTYGQTRNAPTGDNSSCGSWYWVYYCVNYGVAPFERRRYEQNTCTTATRNDELVAYDSPDCGYVAPSYDPFYISTVASAFNVCTRPVDQLAYCTGGFPSIGKTIYTDSIGSSTLAGGYYNTDNGYIHLNGSGVVDSDGTC